MVNEEKIRELLSGIVAETPLFIVDVKVKPSDRIAVEADSDAGITIDECAFLNRSLSAKLEEINLDAEIEVSSPGLGKPFRVLRQYQKAVGRHVQVQMLDGTSCQGLLKLADEKGIVLVPAKKGKKKNEEAAEEFRAAYKDIKSTKEIIQF